MRIDSSYFRLLIYLNARRPISQISFIVSKGHTQPVTFLFCVSILIGDMLTKGRPQRGIASGIRIETSGIGWRGR